MKNFINLTRVKNIQKRDKISKVQSLFIIMKWLINII